MDLALGANDLPGAQAALATMEAEHPEELLTETTRAYFVLVAGEDALPARTAARAVVASVDTPNALAGAEVGGFVLHAAYPNPFNPQAVVPFSVAEASRVQITVFDLLGREVVTL
ncbi:MAG: T9SS type A sorting domain-containing protein, partial [Bacteroidetes bacterium]|nr:T9SS type A sorting domain-containing protein [Bacteroidota bacterium]